MTEAITALTTADSGPVQRRPDTGPGPMGPTGMLLGKPVIAAVEGR